MIFINQSANVVAQLKLLVSTLVSAVDSDWDLLVLKVSARQSCAFILKSTIKNWVTMDLLDAFTSFNSCSNMVNHLIDNTDAAVAVLALEGLYRIEGNVAGGQFSDLPREKIKELLRKWRCESPMYQSYSGAYGRVPPFLRSLTIFKTLEVPLFIDNYGRKELLRNYEAGIEDIDINEETPIYHVTHSEEAKKIVEEKRLKPSNNKNIIEGCWFGQLDYGCSVYGSRAFKTTLSRLGIRRLHQGEIVSYKREINVILYAADDGEAGFSELSALKKPKLTDEEVTSGAYVKVSIFVPSSFLPNTDVDFYEVFSGPIEVNHGPICVKAKRSREPYCAEFLE